MPADPGPARIPVSVRLRPDLVDRARQLARDLAGKPLYLTFPTLVEMALEREIARLERLHGVGEEPVPKIRTRTHMRPNLDHQSTQ